MLARVGSTELTEWIAFYHLEAEDVKKAEKAAAEASKQPGR